jgi:phosphatidate cytidylyltransferase
MSPLISRLLVAAVGLPSVLLLVWLGGWWLFGLAALVCVVALHEFYWLARPLRPVVLGGYAGGLAALLGAELGGLDWTLAGFLSTLGLAFLLKGVAATRQSAIVSVAVTLLGAGWIGLGLAHALLLRDIPEHGRLALFTVLLAVFAGDTAAFFAGKLVGRRRLAPAISPGKTWEGFIVGAVVTIFVAWTWLYDEGYIEGWRSLALGAALAVAAPLGDLFESSLKRDVQVKDTGRLLGGHGGMLDRLDSLLFSLIVAFYVILAFGRA